MTLPYNINIPFATNDPSVDQPNMEQNNNTINTFVAVDHLGFNNQYNGISNSGGWHTDIHFIPQTNSPVAITNIGQLYTQIVTNFGQTDVALFFESGTVASKPFVQLTAPNGRSLTLNGYTFLPGGIILQWGNYSAAGGNFSSGSTTNASAGESVITFPTPFPNNLFFFGGNLTYTQSNLPSGTGTLNARNSQLNSGAIASVSWQVYCNTNNYIGFEWYAIGY